MPPSEDTPAFPPLPCSTIVYRVITRRTWFDKRINEPTTGAFMKRERRPDGHYPDSRGLSTYITATYSLEQIHTRYPGYHVVTLHVGRMRDIGLDICQDSPIHANIIGLPHKDDDPNMAEYFAGMLRDMARLVPKE